MSSNPTADSKSDEQVDDLRDRLAEVWGVASADSHASDLAGDLAERGQVDGCWQNKNGDGREGLRKREARRLSSTSVTPVVSAELFAIPVDEGFIVYAPLRRAAFVANARVVCFIAALQKGRFDRAADPDGALTELLRRLQIVDSGPEVVPVTTFEGTPEPTAITLLLTTTCNLRCTYCYASAGDTAPTNMGLDTAIRGIDFVAANTARRRAPLFEINYHGGGEPFNNWRVMKESLVYARAKARELGLEPPVASAASNGVLLDEQVDWIVANLNGGMSLSFDGLPAAHDRHRLTVHGQGSSARVMDTLRRFDAAGYAYGIRMTVTSDQIEHLADSVEFICASFGPRRIQIEPAYEMGRWKGAPSAETDAFIAAYRAAQARAAGRGREVFFSAARLGTLTNHFCGVTRDTFALSPDGNVSACYEVFAEDHPRAGVFFYGRRDESAPGYSFALPVLDHLRRQAVQHREHCSTCFAKWSCAGDCYHKAVSVTGELNPEGTDRCRITRELTKDQILTRIARSGGVFWHEAPPDRVPESRAKETHE